MDRNTSELQINLFRMPWLGAWAWGSRSFHLISVWPRANYMISVSLPFLTHSMKTVTVTTSQVGVSMKETMHNKEWEEGDTVCAGFTRSSSYSSKTRDALPPSERTACFSNCDFNMVKEMKHKGRIRSWGFLRFKNNFKNAHFQLCKWPKLLISQATNLIHT